jgi:large subunit ribosomal protein L17
MLDVGCSQFLEKEFAMRHLKRTAKLGRTSEHRNAMLANLVCSLIEHKRVTTTLAKAKAARSVAEKMVTLGKSGTIHDRRLAVARLHQEDAAKILFKEIAPAFKERNGGYTRIIKMNQRNGDAATRAILEWGTTSPPHRKHLKPLLPVKPNRRKALRPRPSRKLRRNQSKNRPKISQPARKSGLFFNYEASVKEREAQDIFELLSKYNVEKHKRNDPRCHKLRHQEQTEGVVGIVRQ